MTSTSLPTTVTVLSASKVTYTGTSLLLCCRFQRVQYERGQRKARCMATVDISMVSETWLRLFFRRHLHVLAASVVYLGYFFIYLMYLSNSFQSIIYCLSIHAFIPPSMSVRHSLHLLIYHRVSFLLSLDRSSKHRYSYKTHSIHPIIGTITRPAIFSHTQLCSIYFPCF